MQECRPDFPQHTVCAEEAGVATCAEIGKSAPVKAGSYLSGAAWALLAISIWAGWFVSTRFSVSSNPLGEPNEDQRQTAIAVLSGHGELAEITSLIEARFASQVL